MIVERKVLKFDCVLWCLLKIRDDWSGNDAVTFRKVHTRNNRYFCKTPEGEIDVTADVLVLVSNEADIDKWRRWYHDTNRS